MNSRPERPKLLFLCQTLPFPPDGGVSIRSYNILRLLSETYDVTALFFFRRRVVRSVEDSVAGLQQLCDPEVFPIPQEHSRVRRIADHVSSVLSGRVYTYFAYDNRAFRRSIEKHLLTSRFDIIHVDSLDLSTFLPEFVDMPVVCTHHNVESALLRRRAAVERSRVVATYLRLQARLMAREEERWCPRVSLNVMVSEPDEASLRARIPSAKTIVVPNGVDVEAFRPGNVPTSGIVFVGGLSWYPNLDALEYFTSSIHPRISGTPSDRAVTWVGRATSEEVKRYSAAGIHLTGYVDDIQPYVHAASCYIVPLRIGGGTRLKILDAWAMGKAVVSTSQGCEGLDALDGVNILIRDDPQDFADAVSRVLSDSELRHSLGEGARRTAEQTYSWNVIGNKMIPAYLSLSELT